MRLQLRHKLLLSHFVAVLLVSGSVGTLTYKVAVDSVLASLRSRLMYSAALLSQAVDARALESLRGAEDVTRPEYLQGVQLLRDFQASSQDLAFIYVMRREGDRVFFVLDSDSSPDQALPGQEYTDVIPSLRQGFVAPSADSEVVRDQWGTFLSGYAPLRNGHGHYLVGLDMHAEEVQRKFRAIRLTGLVSLLASLLVAWLFSSLQARRITRNVETLTGRATEIAEGSLEGRVAVRSSDELQDLAGAFNRMSERLQESQGQTRQALSELQEARDRLEARVGERTAELVALNEDLRREMAERSRAQEGLARAATTDFLTGLLNRPAMLRLLEQEVERVKRTTPAFSILLADVDHIQEINDTLGPQAGDQVLQQVAALLLDCVRSQDALARWGGDELLLFLPETPLAGAMQVGSKLLMALSECPQMVGGQGLSVTVSIGVAVIEPGHSVTDCIRQADQALARAKAEGRNRVVAATS